MSVVKKITISLYIIIVVALAICKDYNSWYMTMLWAALAAAGVVYIVGKRKSLSSLSLPGWGLHLAFLVMLSGAMVTHLTQRKGMIHLRQGEPMAYFIDEEDRIFKFNYQMRLDSFRVVLDEEKRVPEDYESYVTILPSGDHEIISMNNILKIGPTRFYQSSYDEDGRGSILIINRDPWGIPVTYAGYLLMGLSFIGIVLRRSGRKHIIGSLALAAFIAALFSLKQYDVPVLNTWLRPVHISLIIAAYVLFLLAVWWRRLLVIALAFLACGIFIGAYWANISWGTYWSWDPKEVWALITLMVYAVPVHTSSLPRFRDQRFYRAYMLLALLSIAMTYFGVNYFLHGMHSYA